MNILILGYGKMGKVIEQIAISRGHQVVYKINLDNLHEMAAIDPAKVDVAIEFSGPESAVANIIYCFENHIPVVCGSTGWLHRKTEVETMCMQKEGTFFYASNFSVGVNIFFRINQVLAELISRYPGYGVSMEEVHHTEKKDAPSGTALTLATDILNRIESKTSWVNAPSTHPSQLSIISKREAGIPGTHVVKYDSAVDSFEIRHEAHNREGFALGAVIASEWIQGKKGVFGMADMLAF